MRKEILQHLSERPIIPSTRFKPESLVEHWAAHKIPRVPVVEGVVREAVIIRARYRDDQGRRCSRYVAEVFICNKDENAALLLAEQWATAHNSSTSEAIATDGEARA
jgi:hypothetical protein